MADRLEELRITDPVLSAIALGYVDPEFVGEALFPIVPVGKEAGKYLKFGKEAFRLHNAIRAIRTASARIDLGVDYDDFHCEEYSLTAAIDDRERDEAAENLNPEIEATQACMKGIMRAREKRYADLARTSGNYAAGHYATLTGDDQWSNDNSNPIVEIKTQRNLVASKIGVMPNTLLLGLDAYSALQDHPAVIERIKYSERGVVTGDLLQSLMDIPRIVVGMSMYASGTPGSETFTSIWGKDAVLAYVPGQPARRMPSYGYTFRRSGYPKTPRAYRDEACDSDVVKTKDLTAEKMTSDVAGYLWINAAA